MINKYKSKGGETVEFAMIAVLFFAVLFAIIECGRALFVWNALAEVTRRGARMAVVCPYQSPIPAQVAIFDVIGGTLATSPIINGLTPAKVSVRYFNSAGTVATNPMLIEFVEVSITGYTYSLIIPLWGSSFTVPAFTTTLPTESLGAVPTFPPDSPAVPTCDF